MNLAIEETQVGL